MKMNIDQGNKNTIKAAINRMIEKMDAKISSMTKHTNDELSSCKRTLGYQEGLIQKKISLEDLKPINSTIQETRDGLEKDIAGIMEHIRKSGDYGRRIGALEGLTKNMPAFNSFSEGDSKHKSGKGGEADNENYNVDVNIKCKMIDDNMKNLKANLESLKGEMEKKADTTELIKIENTKVSKEELLSLLPSEDSKDILKDEFKNEIAYFHKSIDELARAWDIKLVKLRKEIDLFAIKKDIRN